MGFFKSIKRAVKKITKPITKVVKKVAKKVAKIGKAVMKGVAKVSNKLGPIGMIALSIAMPYALAGLSSMTTAAMGYSQVGAYGNFIRAVGTVGNTIRTGYQAFNASMTAGKSWLSGKMSGISKNIGKVFQNFAPKGEGNIFSRISQGAKNLYTSAKNTVKKYMPKPLKGAEGTVDFYDMDGVGTMTSTDAAAAIKRGTLDASMIGEQTLSSKGGFFTSVNKAGVNADKLITETINDAYKIRLDELGPNARRMFDDVKAYTMKADTYVSDEQIGNYITSNSASTTTAIPTYDSAMDFAQPNGYKLKTEIADLGKTGDYTLGTARDRLTESSSPVYNFNGNETFKAEAMKPSILKKTASSIFKDTAKSLLKPTDSPDLPMAYDFASDGGITNDVSTSYAGTQVVGTSGGDLVAKVYGDTQANNMKNYYKNMNILNSGEMFTA